LVRQDAVVADEREDSPQTGHVSFAFARAYGRAALRTGYAFTRAGLRCVGAVIDAGIETVEAFGSARRSTHTVSHEQSAAHEDASSAVE
jgi:hypothetical protein